MADTNYGTSNAETEAIQFFCDLKKTYANQRDIWEPRWEQARAALNLTDSLDQVYNGRANIKSPAMFIKARGIWSRLSKIIFNIWPFGRLEETKTEKTRGDIIDLHNDYIFDYQLDKINYKEAQKMLFRDKCSLGTSVGKVTQESEKKKITYDDDQEPIEVTVKDDTYLRPLLIEEFYSDVNKFDIDESQACIHSTTISMNDLYNNRERTITTQEEIIGQDEQGNEIVLGVEEKSEQVGVYKNLNLLIGDSENITAEQEEYMQEMGWSNTACKAYKKSIKNINKTGFVHIDECYGLFDLKGNGELEEVICVIAEGKVCIRLEPTPFKHKRYVRPFIIGRYYAIPNCLYGMSNVILGHNLLQEYNASRAQATDARTRSVAPMWYQDITKDVNWDNVWRPNGVIRGNGPNGMLPIINPNLQNVGIQDSLIIQQDLDRLWSLSPVQEGTTDPSLIPSTARGTMAVISQNDMPINDLIDDTIEFEIKKFIEMLFERNLTFKTIDEYKAVWDDEKINAALDGVESMTDLMFDFNVKILGSLELENEISHQQGYIQFAQLAMQIPEVSERVNWQVWGDKQLASFGIKDDSNDDLWLTDEQMKAKQKAEQEQLMMQEQMRQKVRLEENEDFQFQEEVKTQGKIVEKQAEASLEAITGEKVA